MFVTVEPRISVAGSDNHVWQAADVNYSQCDHTDLVLGIYSQEYLTLTVANKDIWPLCVCITRFVYSVQMARLYKYVWM